MPSIAVNRDLLFSYIGRTFADDEFDNLCFEYGIELDEITTESQLKLKEEGKGEEARAKTSDQDVIYKIDIPANRTDLLCIEGIALNLKVFLGNLERMPLFVPKPNQASPMLEMHLSKACSMVRPYVVAGILRNVRLTEASYKSFIDLQEKLHFNIGRRRNLVAIGTHDFDKIKGPFLYDARPGREVKFTALNQTTSKNAYEWLEYYEHNHQQLKAYVPLLKKQPQIPTNPTNYDDVFFERVPVIYGDNGSQILSMPPIINGDHSKISTETRNIFVECTANDFTRAQTTLNTIVATFITYSQDLFPANHPKQLPSLKHLNGKIDEIHFEQVKVVYPFTSKELHDAIANPTPENAWLAPYKLQAVQDTLTSVHEPTGQCAMLTPSMDYYKLDVNLSYLNKRIGISLPADKIPSILQKMSLRVVNTTTTTTCEAASTGSDHVYTVEIPPTRSDIMHACDIMEDVAISYGYTNIVSTVPKVVTTGKELPINYLSDLLRGELAMYGYTEALTLSLCSLEESYTFLGERIPDMHDIESRSVRIANPATFEFQMVRISLVPGLLKTLNSNKGTSLPISIFEISDVVYKDYPLDDPRCKRADSGCYNRRNLALATVGNQASNFELIHGTLDRIMHMLRITKVSANQVDQLTKELSETNLAAGSVPSNTSRFDQGYYYLQESSLAMYFPGRSADIYYVDSRVTGSAPAPVQIGSMGILHPDILLNFELLKKPCSVLEIDIQYFI